MKIHELKIQISKEQLEAVQAEARRRNCSQATLIRDLISAATGVEHGYRRSIFSEVRGMTEFPRDTEKKRKAGTG